MSFKDPGQLSSDDRNTSDGISEYYRRKAEERRAAAYVLEVARKAHRNTTPETYKATLKALRRAELAYEVAGYVGD